MNREQHIRDTAYAIWMAEGCPEGRSEQNWMQAEAQMEQATSDHQETRTRKPAPEKIVGVTRTTRKSSKTL
jgi:hypothetical protein